ncbi:MAG: TraM recognition domain-containing protein [Bacteroidetes bacterium]|nr:TraM recognition domain-containing protein [Bacteroidota bacterium]
MVYLDTPLFYFDANKQEPWTIRDAVRGTQIFGGIGSGKTSGSGKWIAKSFLMNGFGGLVLCGKPEEAADWIKYAEETNRQKDIILFEKGSDWQFNPLQYEMTRDGKGSGETMNIVNLFMNIYRMGQRLNGGGDTQESERFWEGALRRAMNRMVDLIKLSGEDLSVSNMVELLNTAPQGESVIHDLAILSSEAAHEWIESNYCLSCLEKAEQNATSPEEERDFNLCYNYFLRDYAKLPEKTRTTIEEMFFGLAEPFNSGILNDHFSGGLNLFPEMTFEGKIILLDFPVKDYLDAGVYAQSIFKLLWQQCTERRKVDDHTKPVFLWVDESQYFVNEYDMMFQTTARSSMACTVFLSQNISNYYAVMGGKSAEARVNSLLGNLSTKIFHANNDHVTNEWAANTIGKAFKNITSVNIGNQQSAGLAQQLHWQVEPREFTVLKNGGDENKFLVDAVVTIAGRVWKDGKNYGIRQFYQKI